MLGFGAGPGGGPGDGNSRRTSLPPPRMMEYGALPPEINSTLLYAGPGPGPLLEAAAQWDALAAELFATADSVESTVSGVTESWEGSSSSTMASAAGQYVGWLTQTATQSQQTATHATAAATAYEDALATTVSPAVVVANREEIGMLIAGNMFGQNTAAIAVNESQYGEMWAQNAEAMYSYAAASAVATSATTPFEPAPAVVNSERTATHATAAAPAHEDALATTEDVVSNRMEYLRLLVFNHFGQNTAALAANQSQYGEMWAPNAEAMYHDAAASAVATNATTPFEPAVVSEAVAQHPASQVMDVAPQPLATPGTTQAATPTEGASSSSEAL